MKLWTTEHYDALTLEQVLLFANGCGPVSCRWCAKFLDNALGVHVFDACLIHDVDYEIGGDAEKRRQDDIRFICNLLVITLSVRSWWNAMRVPYLFIYYVAVRISGRKHYNYREEAPT